MALGDVVTISNQFVVHVLQCHGCVSAVWPVVEKSGIPLKVWVKSLPQPARLP